MEDGLTFSEWFLLNGCDEQHRDMFMIVWGAALDNAKKEIDEESSWALDRLRT